MMKMAVATEAGGDSAAQGLFEDFFRAADDFAAMQQEHRAALLAGNGKNLFSWRQGREQAFRGLVRLLDKVVDCGQDDQGCAVRAWEITKKLLAEEGELQELVLARQLQVQEQILAMRKGKEALQGYNMNQGLVPRPSYLSSRM